MTEVAEAERLVLEHLPRLGASRERLSDCVDRVLAEDVTADRDQPPFDRVTMDGIAIAGRDWESGVRAFSIAGTQAAGAPPLALGGPRRCVEVMTGAMLPRGADTVIPVERITRDGGTATVDPRASVTSRQYVHPRGSDRRAGGLLLSAGTRIGPPEVAVLASAGSASVAVAALPHVAIVSTGDELVEVDEPLAEYQIRSSNDRAIEASLLRARLARVTRARLRDDTATLRTELATLLKRADVLVLSGGVSMGQFDLVPGVLAELGASRIFHRVQQRPGKPLWFGVGARGQPIFALPGNPVSTLVCATRYLVPALRTAAGLASQPAEHVTLAAPAEAMADLTHFMPVKLAWSNAGAALATPCPTNTSGDFAALAGTDGFVELPPRRGEYAQGTAVRLFRW
jgi:molybdopterin molybdotransferase